MLRALNLCQDAGNDQLSTDSEYDNHSCINSPFRQDLNQVDSSTNLLDKVILTKVVTRPTQKPRSVGLHKSIPKKNRNKRKSCLENKKLRSVSKPLYVVSVDPSSNNGIKPQRHLLYKNKDKNNYLLMDTSTSIPIFFWKSTKKQSHIIRNMSIPGRLPYFGSNHRFELNTESPSMSDKDIRLLYSLIERLLFISRITRPDVHACVSYIITRMELPTIYHKNRHLNVDVLFVKKIQLFVLSSTEDRSTHLESLFSKHSIYLLNIIQQIIQSQIFKNVSTTLKKVLKNMIKWFDSDPHTNFIKHCWNTNSSTTSNTLNILWTPSAHQARRLFV